MAEPADPSERSAPARRRRRRAVGPPGAAPQREVGLAVLQDEAEPFPGPEADEHLRREVPPHHGG